MSEFLNILVAEAERGELEECFLALDELLNQIEGIGIPDWHGAEGLCLKRAKTIVANIKGEELPQDESEFSIRWSAEDILALRPNWTLKERENWLQMNWKRIQDRSIELGWEVIENLLSSKGEKS